MSDAVMLTITAVALVAVMIFLVRRNGRTKKWLGRPRIFEMMLLKPVAFLQEDVYGLITMAAILLVAAFPNSDPATTMFKPSTREEGLTWVALPVVGIGIYVFFSRFWWATGIPQWYKRWFEPASTSESDDERRGF